MSLRARSSRPALANCTNVYTNNIPSPWTILQLHAGTKRPSTSSGGEDGSLKKRAKVSCSNEQHQKESTAEAEYSDEENNSDVEMEDMVNVTARGRRGTVFGMMNAASLRLPGSRRGLRRLF
jgi:hypothetical protein